MAREPAILVLAPMPAAPASAGNRRRLVATYEALARGGFAVDLAYLAHEDQVYRRFGQHPPTDFLVMGGAFRNVFLIEPRGVIPLKTRAPCFGIDEWCPPEAGEFVAWYFSQFPETRAALINYVFLSAALERVPPGVLRLIDTHDRFAGRQTQYRPFRAEPNFFYTDAAGEAAGLARADIVLAIQAAEARHFAEIAPARVLLLPPLFPAQRPFAVPERVARIGFLGHGNDPNLFSIGRFVRAWAQDWTPDRPELVIAGEICRSLAGIERPGVRLLGYLDRLADFYAQADLVVAPMLMGSGLKMKVGEALCFGCPVIGTEIGLEGFEPDHPAHRCRDADAVKAAVLAAVGDRAALVELTAASERLFARYGAVAEAAEAELIGLLRSHEEGRFDRSSCTKDEDSRLTDEDESSVSPPPCGEEGGGGGGSGWIAEPHPAPPPPRTPPHKGEGTRASAGNREPITASGGGLAITAEHSSRSLPTTDPDLGVLVATERRPGDGSAAAYAPERRRWFARVSDTDGPVPRLGALDVALSPEWVRTRALPPAARAALALAFADMAADWEAVGRIIGRAGDRIELATLLPGVLASGAHPTAAFLIGEGAGTELRLERVTPLQIRPAGAYADRTGRLPAPVPVSLSLRGAATPSAKAILLLTDDGIGRITLEAS